MQILFLNAPQTLFLDIIVWTLLHLGIGYCASKIPADRFDPNGRFYQTLRWEKGGMIYQQLFHVRSWKRLIPNGSQLYRDTFSIKDLPSVELNYLERWVKESIRPEFCHRMMIFPSIFFFLWNSAPLGWLMVAYAVLNNFFPIVAQRFNRPRIRSYLDRAKGHSTVQHRPSAPAQPAYAFARSRVSERPVHCGI